MHQMAKSIASTFEPWQRKRLARCMSAFAALGCRLSIGIELESVTAKPLEPTARTPSLDTLQVGAVAGAARHS